MDFPDAAVVLPSLDHRLLLGHLRVVLLLGHADRTDAATVEELLDNRLIAGQQHLPRPEHHQLAPKQHAHVVRHRARDVDVVRDDEDRAVDLHVDADLLTG